MSEVLIADPRLQPFLYRWPSEHLRDGKRWRPIAAGDLLARDLPESNTDLAADSRWPAFFPCAISIVTTAAGGRIALEKVVGASIVNRFPYVVALSFCTQELSARHHPRNTFLELVESGGNVALQFLTPGDQLARVMSVINDVAEVETDSRMGRTGLRTVKAKTNDAPVFDEAYLVYEATLVQPSRDIEGRSVFDEPWLDVGSHRILFFEINAIQLRRDIAEGRSQIAWRSLPVWQPRNDSALVAALDADDVPRARYQKGYTPNYLFPSAATIAFAPDAVEGGMATKLLRKQSWSEIRCLSNDEARWPCFFPSSLGMITTLSADGTPNLMPCGSTTVVSRQPMVIAICVSYGGINERYAPRASLEILRQTGKFCCGVAYANDAIVDAIKYAGNISLAEDSNKLARAGLLVKAGHMAPILPALPIHFECEVVDEKLLGTHAMFLGEVKRILVRTDVTPDNPLVWCPWADVVSRHA